MFARQRPTPGLRAQAAPANPSVWLMLGHKIGDNNQVQALAEGLGWVRVEKRIRYRPWELITNRLLGTTLAGIRREESDSLDPPWPDLVISAGRRNEPVARWIKKQSGDKTRLVHIGRPWASLDCFDLVVSTPQYSVPAGPRVLGNDLPLHRLTKERLEAGAASWAPRLAHLPRPWIAVLIGGNSGPWVFTPAKLERLAAGANELAAGAGGSLLVSTSARTPSDALETMRRAATVPGWFWGFEPDSDENPYLGYLALADAFVVTGESMSMLTESCATGRPVHVFDPGDAAAARPRWLRPETYRPRSVLHAFRSRLGPRRLRRDIGAIQRRLIASGRASWLGSPPAAAAPSPAPAETLRSPDLERAVARVRALFHEKP